MSDISSDEEIADPRLTDAQRVEQLARALAEKNSDRDGEDLIWEPYTDDAKTLLAMLPELGYVDTTVPGTVEWAVQSRDLIDGPWDRIDDGSRWSRRNGKKFTKREARADSKRRVNGIEPELWRRCLTRTVHYGPWVPSPGRPRKKATG